MATRPTRLTVLGETYEFRTTDSTAAEISRHVDVVTDARSSQGDFLHAVRGLVLRHADNVEPEGAPRCDLVRDLLAEPRVRQRILDAGDIRTEEPAITAVDLSYGQLVSIGGYANGKMRYTPLQARTLLTVAVWLGEGATIGRGYELVESRHRMPAEVLNVYRKPMKVLPATLGTEQLETLRTLLRDGMHLHEALEAASLL